MGGETEIEGDVEVAVVWDDNEKSEEEKVEPVLLGTVDVVAVLPVAKEANGLVDEDVVDFEGSFAANDDAILDMTEPVWAP